MKQINYLLLLIFIILRHTNLTDSGVPVIVICLSSGVGIPSDATWMFAIDSDCNREITSPPLPITKKRTGKLVTETG
jgi:hypothetical protein